jgi:hypothetical protein
VKVKHSVNLVVVAFLFTAAGLRAQIPSEPPIAGSGIQPPAATAAVDDNKWQPQGVDTSRAKASLSSEGAPSLDAHKVRPAAAAAPSRVGGKDMLPADKGQVWQQYDISVYTSQVKDSENPQQAIIDWILRETGTEVWFSEPLGLLSANRDTLSVYHTPEMQRVVADMVGRFVNGTQDPHVLSLRLIAVNSPSWRANYLTRLRGVPVQAPGVEAWLISKEDAALLLAELRRRSDFREHGATNLVFFNGQSQTIGQQRPRNYVRSYRSRPPETAWMGYEVDWARIQEGYTLQVSPLLSQDERTIEAVLKCNIDQVEKLVSVSIDLPGLNGQVQRADIQVPQLVSWRLHERFRWPTSHILLLSCGVVASPGPERPTTLGIPNPFARGGGRADALLFVESRGKASKALVTGQTTTAGGQIVNPGARY